MIFFFFRQALDYFNFPKHFLGCLSGFAMDKVTALGQSKGKHSTCSNVILLECE